MNDTNVSGSQNKQDCPLVLPGWSSPSSDVSDDFDLHCSRVVSKTSSIDQGGDSTGLRMPLSIKPQGMLNTHVMMQQLWRPTHYDKALKP